MPRKNNITAKTKCTIVSFFNTLSVYAADLLSLTSSVQVDLY